MTVYFSQPCSGGIALQLPLSWARIKYPCERAGQRYMQEETSGAMINVVLEPWPPWCSGHGQWWCWSHGQHGVVFHSLQDLPSQKHRLLFIGMAAAHRQGEAGRKDRWTGAQHPIRPPLPHHLLPTPPPLFGQFWVIPT